MEARQGEEADWCLELYVNEKAEIVRIVSACRIQSTVKTETNSHSDSEVVWSGGTRTAPDPTPGRALTSGCYRLSLTALIADPSYCRPRLATRQQHSDGRVAASSALAGGIGEHDIPRGPSSSGSSN